MRVVAAASLRSREVRSALAAGTSLDAAMPVAREIVEDVRRGGDAALREYTQRFDGADIATLRVSSEEIDAAYRLVDASFLAALRAELAAVRAFHETHLVSEHAVETAPGVLAWRAWRGLHRVGLYIPGGRARYPSSVVMLAVPARVAGCEELALVTPPSSDGSVPPHTLVAAAECGITEIYSVGGAQAIAALAYGTESIRAVDKIFGAGNAYVTAAKLLVFPTVAIDTPAGPSELLVVAENDANPAWIAADLLSNCEHGPDSPTVLVTNSERLAHSVAQEIEQQLRSLPRRDIATASLHGYGLTVIVEDMDEAVRIVNDFAPEHLELLVEDPHALLARVRNAGSIFLGPYSPNAAGDYATGTNHVLPTAGYARMFAPLSVEAFGRALQVQELTLDGVRSLAPSAATLARAEGLEGHARAVEIRAQERAGD